MKDTVTILKAKNPAQPVKGSTVQALATAFRQMGQVGIAYEILVGCNTVQQLLDMCTELETIYEKNLRLNPPAKAYLVEQLYQRQRAAVLHALRSEGVEVGEF